MASLNKVTLIGNLGKDPEIKYVSEGLSVARFTMATSEAYKDKNDQWIENTEWHNIVAWRYLAEKAANSLKKGTQVYVEGKITNRSYDDKDGVKRYITEIIANSIMVLSKREGSAVNDQTETHLPDNPPHDMPEDDLPF